MFTYKRVLTLWLGLFFCITETLPLRATETTFERSNLFSGDFSTGAGTLWIEDDGASGYWHSGLNLAFGQNFSLGFDIGQIIAKLPWMDASILGGIGEFNFNTTRGGLLFRSGFFTHQQISIAIDNSALSNQGGNGFFIGLETPLYFGHFSITPCFYYGKAIWDEGDMYWFFGKPDIPAFLAFGLSLGLDQQYTQIGKFKHTLAFRWSLTDIVILSNENKPIFDANLNGTLFYYTISLERARNSFSTTFGWFYTRTSIDGGLTTANQPYFLFPFRFFNINLSIDTHTGFAFVGLQDNHSIFQYDIRLGLFHIFYDQGEVNIHYQMKRLFGSEESFETINPEFKGIGAAFLLLGASIPAIYLGQKRQFSVGLQKAFFLPWGYDKLLASVSTSSPQDPQMPDLLPLVKTILLSGLSFRFSLSW